MFPEPFWQVLINASYVIRSTWNSSILKKVSWSSPFPTLNKGHLPSQQKWAMSTTMAPPHASCVCWLRAFCQRGPKALRQALLEMRSGGNSSRPRPGCRFLVQIIWINCTTLDTIVATNCASKSVVFCFETALPISLSCQSLSRQVLQ